MASRALVTRLDYTHLQFAPNDGKRYELLDGRVFVTPAPGPQHQRACKRLQRILERYFEERRLGEVFDAPIDVILNPHDVVQPDLVALTNAAQVSERGIEGPPTILVEVLSPSTAGYDRTLKTDRYAATGVPHFFLVDIEARRLDCLRLAGGRYAVASSGDNADTLRHPDFPELAIPLATLWEK